VKSRRVSTPAEADQLRRSMATFKVTGGVSYFKDKLIGGMVERGYSLDFAERTFSQIEGFGSYGFRESHAASFALIAYASSWMKCHHPDVFCAALLNAQPVKSRPTVPPSQYSRMSLITRANPQPRWGHGWTRNSTREISIFRNKINALLDFAWGQCWARFHSPRNAAARFTTDRARSTTGTSIIAPSNCTAPSPLA
jgi:hypothetical protein